MITSKQKAVKRHLNWIISPALVALARGFAVVTIGALFSRLLSAIAGILLVRYFDGPALYGQYATLITTLALMANLLGFGFDTWLLHEGGRDPNQLSFNVHRLLALKFIAASILIGAMTIAWSQDGISWLLIIGMLGVIAESYIRTGHVVLHSINRNSLVAILQSLDSLLLVVLVLILMIWPPSVAILVVGQTVVSGITLVVVAVLLAEYLHGSWRPLHLGYLMQSASFFVLSDVLASIYSQSQIAILAFFTNDIIVGTFRSAINLIAMSFLVPLAMFNVGLPMLSRSSLDQRQRRQLLLGMIGMATLYGIAMFIGFWWFGGDVLRLVYGTKYDAAIPLLKPLSIVPLAKSLSFVAVAIMLALGAQRLRVIIQSILMVASLLSGLALIPRFGLDGATLTYSTVEVVLCVFYWAGAIHTLRMKRL